MSNQAAAKKTATYKYPGIRATLNGNQLVAYYTEARLADAGVFYPITPSTEMGELFQQSYAEGKLNVFGRQTIAIEAEGEHAAQGGAIAASITGKRVVNFTSGQGITYGVEQYYHAPGKLSTMVIEVAARALTKHALNVHCGHDDFCAALDVGWIMVMAKDAQQAADQSLILRTVTEKSLTPGMNIQDGFLTSHLERTFLMHESELMREFVGAPEDIIDCPTEAQRELFGPTRRRIPEVIDLKNPALIGPVQNQEHYMNGVIARRNHFYEPILGFLEEAFEEFGKLTGRHYGLLTEHNTEGADTVFLSLGCAAENVEAAVDHVAETRGETVGSIHLNVLRPFPEAALVNALRGKKNVIILERTDEALAGDNPIARDVRTALSKALDQHKVGTGKFPSISAEDTPRIFSGSYGLGSRDFRPEAILGALEYVQGKITRKDGAKAVDGEYYFTLGIDHPYCVESKDAPSLLPDDSIAVRLHSIGGWGMITTGKNLGAIIGAFGEKIAEDKGIRDEYGRLEEAIHVSANPKYGSEKKGAPTEYFLVVAPKRVRVTCDLRHVGVVLCCDPKAFTHFNPLEGIADGGAFVWENDETPEKAWERIPKPLRKEIVDRKIRLFVLPGFAIARKATDRPELQLRMQGNSFLGAFFKVSPFLKNNNIDKDHFHSVVRAQYEEKFGRFGQAVVDSNMEVMTQGFELVKEVPHGEVEAQDRSAMRGKALLPLVRPAAKKDAPAMGEIPMPAGQKPRPPLQKRSYFDKEFRAGLGYHQPASPLAAVGTMAAATGATASKYVARRETPVFYPENCTQCMQCIAVCPDTALPNTAQDVMTVLSTTVESYVSEPDQRKLLLGLLPDIEKAAREEMRSQVKAKGDKPFKEVVSEAIVGLNGKVSSKAMGEISAVLDVMPFAYAKVNTIFNGPEKKNPGAGGVFSIIVSDLCKGCGECVTECGDHDALRMKQDSESLNAHVEGATKFMDLLKNTEQKHLGLYNNSAPEDARPASLRNHLMVLDNYQAMPSGDGACAGCGEKSVLRAIATLTEAYMRPLYHTKAERLEGLASQLASSGVAKLDALEKSQPEEFQFYRQGVAHLVMGHGGENDKDTRKRIEEAKITNQDLVDGLIAVLRTDAFNHKNLQAVDGRLANGMSAMAMGAHTGCNTVYGSTPPNNPHPYPWMNSLFQDGVTITWLMAESFIMDHARRSVIPERLADALLSRDEEVMNEAELFELSHITDAMMTDLEIKELPKVWGIGGDGGMGDIGFQNASKVVLQNRPNVKILLLDTQVYSNTGGQNSDSSLMTGGFDMNQLGAATQGKLTERKSVSECFTSGHGSPFVAQVSMADAPRLYKAILDGLEYRGTAFYQAFTTCQPEHGVGDDMSNVQATRVRDSRCMAEYVFNPGNGETYQEALDLKGNPRRDRDWQELAHRPTKTRYRYTTAHWAATEARFRRHLKKIKPEAAEKMMTLDNILLCLTQSDVRNRKFLNKKLRSFVPDWGVYMEVEGPKGALVPMTMSRQMVLFCVERRKAWRMLQSKAGIVNKDYKAQKALLAKVDGGEISIEELRKNAQELVTVEYKALK